MRKLALVRPLLTSEKDIRNSRVDPKLCIGNINFGNIDTLPPQDHDME